jgi:hypothetical protein
MKSIVDRKQSRAQNARDGLFLNSLHKLENEESA